MNWISLTDTYPREGKIVLLTGPSGTTVHPNFVLLGYYDEQYRPSRGGPTRWLGITNTALTDYGWTPTHWAEVPAPPPKDDLRLTPLQDKVDERVKRIDTVRRALREAAIVSREECRGMKAVDVADQTLNRLIEGEFDE